MTAAILDKDRVETIRTAFEQQPRLGLVAPDGDLVPLDDHWGMNEDRVANLLGRLGIRSDDLSSGQFVAGTMFWIRLSGLRPILDAHLSESEFEPEDGQLDGTMAHAVERVILQSVEHGGLRIATASSLDGTATESR